MKTAERENVTQLSTTPLNSWTYTSMAKLTQPRPNTAAFMHRDTAREQVVNAGCMRNRTNTEKFARVSNGMAGETGVCVCVGGGGWEMSMGEG